MLAAYNEAFPVGIVDNLFTAEEHLRALPAHLLAMVTEAIR
jgi:alpha-D-ribose 1-methylphosphonate 5-triphosphate synthase subunit PhnH